MIETLLVKILTLTRISDKLYCMVITIKSVIQICIEGGNVLIKVNLKKILKARNMTLSDLSKITGITMKTLSAFQNQKVESVQFNTIDQVTYALNISVEDLITKDTGAYEISLFFDDICNTDEERGSFTIKLCGDDLVHTMPVNFDISKSQFNDRKRIEFHIDEIDSESSLDIFSLPDLPYEYFTRNNNLINHNSYLELISHLLIQEYIYISPENFSIHDEFIVNVHNIVDTYQKNSMSKDEARFNDVGNVFSNNIYAYFVKLTALNPKLHLQSSSISATDKVNANIEYLSKYPFITHIEIDGETYKRKVFVMFE